jgi:hypothetical protein
MRDFLPRAKEGRCVILRGLAVFDGIFSMSGILPRFVHADR